MDWTFTSCAGAQICCRSQRIGVAAYHGHAPSSWLCDRKLHIRGDIRAHTYACIYTQHLNFMAINCVHTHAHTPQVGYVPRVWALPTDHEHQWLAFRSYFTPNPPYLNGSGVHGVYHCSSEGSEAWYWQVSGTPLSPPTWPPPPL